MISSIQSQIMFLELSSWTFLCIKHEVLHSSKRSLNLVIALEEEEDGLKLETGTADCLWQLSWYVQCLGQFLEFFRWFFTVGKGRMITKGAGKYEPLFRCLRSLSFGKWKLQLLYIVTGERGRRTRRGWHAQRARVAPSQ